MAALLNAVLLYRGLIGDGVLRHSPGWGSFLLQVLVAIVLMWVVINQLERPLIWWIGASLMERVYKKLDREPPVDRQSAEMGEHFWYIDSSKAERELIVVMLTNRIHQVVKRSKFALRPKIHDAIVDEQFLILPHPEVADYMRLKAEDLPRWLGGMRKLQRRVLGV